MSMTITLWFFFFFFIWSSLSLVFTVHSQQCVNGTRYAKVVPLCEKYLVDMDSRGKLVYLPAGPRFAVESILSNAGFKASRSIAFLGEECKAAMYPFVCNSVFQLCEEILPSSSSNSSATNTVPVPVPIPMSQNVCERVLKLCGTSVTADQLPNCTATNAATGLSTYPATNQTTVIVNNQDFNVTPVDVQEEIEPPEFPFECPYPMINFPKHGRPPLDEWSFPWPCGLRCPTWYFTSTYSDYKEYWKNIFIYTRVFGALGLVLVIINLVGIFISRSEWFQFPKVMVTGLILLTDLNIFSVIIPAFVGDAEVGCVNDYTGAHAYEWKCAVTGMVTQTNFGALTLCTMILINSVIFFLTRFNRRIQRYVMWFVIVVLILPQAALTPYVFATNDFGGNVNCFYQNINTLTFTISCWLTINCLGWIMVPFPAFFVCKEGGFNPIKKSIKGIVFAIIFLSMYTISDSLGAHDLVQKDAAIAEISDFLTCVITRFVAESTLSDVSGMKPCEIDVPLSKYAIYHYVGSGVLILFSIPIIFKKDFLDGFKKNKDMESLRKWSTVLNTTGSSNSKSSQTTHNSGEDNGHQQQRSLPRS